MITTSTGHQRTTTEAQRRNLKKYDRKNKEKRRAYFLENYNKKRLTHLEQKRIRLKEMRETVSKVLGGRCVGCGEQDSRILCIDHINGNGNKERKHNPYVHLRKICKGEYQEYQLLCYNCNWKKRWENKERHNPDSKNWGTINNRKIRVEAIKILGGKCKFCSIEDNRVLHIDHILGGGTKERKTIKPTSLYNNIVKGLENLSKYQILCANHHQLKTIMRKNVIGNNVGKDGLPHRM